MAATAAAVGAIFLAHSAAGESSTPVECTSNPSTNAEIKACVYDEVEAQERRLDAALAELEGVIGEVNRGRRSNHRVRWAFMREAQRAWVEFRDNNCEFRSDTVRGGTQAPLSRYLCAASLTAARADQVEDYVEIFGGR